MTALNYSGHLSCQPLPVRPDWPLVTKKPLFIFSLLGRFQLGREQGSIHPTAGVSETDLKLGPVQGQGEARSKVFS